MQNHHNLPEGRHVAYLAKMRRLTLVEHGLLRGFVRCLLTVFQMSHRGEDGYKHTYEDMVDRP